MYTSPQNRVFHSFPQHSFSLFLSFSHSKQEREVRPYKEYNSNKKRKKTTMSIKTKKARETTTATHSDELKRREELLQHQCSHECCSPVRKFGFLSDAGSNFIFHSLKRIQFLVYSSPLFNLISSRLGIVASRFCRFFLLILY